jgi:NADH:ubiquinone oxidoreductase subunit E
MIEAEKKAKEPCGAVLVCGGGIAGMQASLDLSRAGFRVYLVEESPTIGGRMARLDKTFPTGDCATCIISPKLVECTRDLNIDIITMADVKEIQGEAGRFKAIIEKRPRSVDESRCTGCGDCWQQCPVCSIPKPEREPEPSEGLEAGDASRVDEIALRHRNDTGALMTVLQEVHRVLGHLPRPAIDRISSVLGLTAAEVLRVASFYHGFRFEAPPRHVVEVCNGTSCYSQGSAELFDRLKGELETAGDPGRFELRTVRCLGLCALSPSMKIDGIGFGRVDPDQVPRILERFK